MSVGGGEGEPSLERLCRCVGHHQRYTHTVTSHKPWRPGGGGGGDTYTQGRTKDKRRKRETEIETERVRERESGSERERERENTEYGNFIQ